MVLHAFKSSSSTRTASVARRSPSPSGAAFVSGASGSRVPPLFAAQNTLVDASTSSLPSPNAPSTSSSPLTVSDSVLSTTARVLLRTGKFSQAVSPLFGVHHWRCAIFPSHVHKLSVGLSLHRDHALLHCCHVLESHQRSRVGSCCAIKTQFHFSWWRLLQSAHCALTQIGRHGHSHRCADCCSSHKKPADESQRIR